MISTNSLSAFTPDVLVARSQAAVNKVSATARGWQPANQGVADLPPVERRLEAAAGGAAPTRILPRGSLVDLRL